MSFLRKTFGEEAGELLESFSMVLVPVLFMAVIMLLFKLMIFTTSGRNEKDKLEKALSDLPQNTKQVILEITQVNKKTSLLLEKLQTDINNTEKAINQKKQNIAELERKIKILKLTPEQTKIIENYNKSISNTDISISDWIKQKTVWYDISISVIISIIFFWLGRQSLKKKPSS